MKILVVNDDGIFAPGIEALIAVAQNFGKVTVVAPDKTQSGKSHAISLNDILYANKVDMPGVEAFSFSGTPVDCVKFSIHKIFGGKKPDLVLSGINHGENHSVNALYSGTMAAAMEGAMAGIPSIGFSLCDFSLDADFSASKKYVEIIVNKIIKNQLNEPICLNVNIPAIAKNKIRGIKICRGAKAHWVEEFEERISPAGKKYFLMSGMLNNDDMETDTDIWALENNFVSVVPVKFDITDYDILNKIKVWE